MEFIEWSESMSVGVPLIDQDHKIIVKLINLFHQNISDEANPNLLGTVLKTLIEYTQYHFAREEKVMQACHYPVLAEHKQQHDRLTHKVITISRQFFEKKENIFEQDLLDFLRDWLIHHILKEDMGYRPYAEHNQQVLTFTSSLQLDGYPLHINDEQSLENGSIQWNNLAALVVSQNKGFNEIIAAILGILNISRIVLNTTGDQALHTVLTEPPSLLIYGWQQQDSGMENFISDVRASIPGTDLPILVISSRDDRGDNSLATAASASACINEPIGIRKLMTSLSEILRAKS